MKERWEYYWGNAGFWFISDKDTNRYFMADHKSDAEWLVEQLNDLEACKAENKPFPFHLIQNKEVCHPYTGE